MCVKYGVLTIVHLYLIVSRCSGNSTSDPSVCFSSSEVTSRTWNLEDYPNPKIDISSCGRGCKSSWICDPDHILSSNQGDELDKLINKTSTARTCTCSNCQDTHGYKINVAIVHDVDTSSKDNVTTDKDFAHYLRLQWHQSKCDNSVLILLVTKSQQVYTDGGINTQDVLTDTCIQEVYDKIQSNLENGKYYKVLHEMVMQYKIILTEGNCDYIERDRILTRAAIIVGSVSGLAVIFFLVLTFIRNKKGNCCYASQDIEGRPTYYKNYSYEGEEEDKARSTCTDNDGGKTNGL